MKRTLCYLSVLVIECLLLSVVVHRFPTMSWGLAGYYMLGALITGFHIAFLSAEATSIGEDDDSHDLEDFVVTAFFSFIGGIFWPIGFLFAAFYSIRRMPL